VQIITNDGRILIGILKGHDSNTNIVLQNTIERVFSQKGARELQLGLYIIRGDSVSLVGTVDDNVEIDWEQVNGHPLKSLHA
ncbi:hypothetical protein EDD86DRAFT_191651, partial [Gorgonomyces haynaldii]